MCFILNSVKYTLTDSSELLTYYFTHNSRGDIIGIYNGAGDLKAHYEYDAWGNVTSITDANGTAITSATHIGNLNPFRYRGYYQDSESGFYYLMSRYYDPVTHRFINADGYFQSGSSILDSNMHAYCANNPINNSDPTGKCSKHNSYYVPTCGYCNPGLVKYANEHLEWLKKVHGQNCAGMNADGTIFYNEKLNIDFNSTESKVIQTVVIFISSFEASADVGFGIGCNAQIPKFPLSLLSLIQFDATSKATIYAELSGRDGLDIGYYAGNEGSISVWDVGPSAEMSGFHSFITGEDRANIGAQSIDMGVGVYVGIGGSISVGFNYGNFIEKYNKVW